MLKLVEQMQLNYQAIRDKYQIVLKFPFSSARKRMSSVIELRDRKTLFIKGASEMVLKCCNTWYNQETQTIEIITSAQLDAIEAGIHAMAE